MTSIPISKTLILLLMLLSVVACNGTKLDEPDITVNAGADQQITLPVERVWLSGEATIEKYYKFKSTSWRQIAGPVQLQLKNSDSLNTEILNLTQPGEYKFRLTVSDFFNQSKSDDVTINAIAQNDAPVVSIGSETVEAIQGTLVSLEATAADTDNEQLSLQWEVTQAPASSDFVLSDEQGLQPQFLAPKVPGDYHLKLVATDQSGAQGWDEVTLKVTSLESTVGPQLTQLMQQLYAQHEGTLANFAFSVSFPEHDYTWQGSAGLANIAEQTEMTPEHPFRIASVTKTMLAYLAVILVDEGYFSLETPLSELLNDSDLPAGYTLDDLHVNGDVKRGGTLTIRQLLDQSTGIRDHVSYVTDPQAPDALSLAAALSPNSIEIPALWSPEAILQNVLDRGLTQNIASAPGEAFVYGNSNSDLLGFVMQKVTGYPLHELLQMKVFAPLGMLNSYLEWHDPVRTSSPVDHFFAITEETHGSDLPDYMYGNHNIRALNVNTSFAWAGGGVVTTLDDTQKFMRAIEGFEALSDDELTQVWHNWTGAPNQPDNFYYAMGKLHMEVDLGDSGKHYFEGHNGAFGSNAYNIKPMNISVVTWDSHANVEAGSTFTLQVLGLLHSLKYQASIEPQ